MCQKIIGTSEIALSVADLPAMKSFYTEVLGFALHSEGAFSSLQSDHTPTISFLTISETSTPLGRHGHPQLLALIDYRRHEFAQGRFDGHDVRRSTLNHLAFEILPAGYESEFERLSSLGLSPMKTNFPNINAKAIFFSDPEKNTLELICYDSTLGTAGQRG